MAKILIADDEPSIVLAVKDELVFEGFDVAVASDGVEALEKAHAFDPDVMLLDLMMPRLNGFEVSRRLREKKSNIWIIMLTARGEEADRVRGFDLGADDYVTKPFSLRELVARVRVGLRRLEARAESSSFSFGDIEVDADARQVHKAGEEVALTPKEYDILTYMLDRPGKVVSRDMMIDDLWGQDVYVTHRVIDTHMASLRKKLEENPNEPEFLRSVRSVGYRFDPSVTES